MNYHILQGDCIARLHEMRDESVQCWVTSPPYWGLRDYGVLGQIGQEKTPEEYVTRMVEVFREARRVLKSDGTLWLNIGDSYAARGYSGGMKSLQSACSATEARGWRPAPEGYKAKDLVGVPWLLAFALRADGWYLRQEIIWAKPNGMPGSQTDRCTSSHESVFLLSKSARYYSDFDAIKTPPRESSLVRLAQDIQAQAGFHRANGGAKTNGPMKAVAARTDKQRGHSRKHAGFNERWDAMSVKEQMSMPVMMRDVWFIAPATFDEAHFAVMPEELARRCILAGSREGDTIGDLFNGSGTTGVVALRHGRHYLGVELNPAYIEIAERRIRADAPLLNQCAPECEVTA